jgi:hypothetical protein
MTEVLTQGPCCRRGVAPALLDFAQPRNVFLMLVEGFGKGMSASAVGGKIEFIGGSRIGDRLDRGATRAGRSAQK